jgi:hypothetical protein
VFARRVKPIRDTTPKPLPGTGQLEPDLQTHAAGWRYEAGNDVRPDFIRF